MSCDDCVLSLFLPISDKGIGRFFEETEFLSTMNGRQAVQGSSGFGSIGNGSVRVGLISDEPIRLAGLFSAFEEHGSIAIVVGDMSLLLADLTLGFVILDLTYGPGWLETQAMVRRMRPEMRQIVFGPGGDEELILRTIAGGVRAYLSSSTGAPAVR